ncbi:MAG: hypothetical protein QGI60_00270, partial [archaeon]|nr:hypothetical protein [archaeon]
MGHSIKTGLSFGLTSGIITTLGLMIGLDAGTHSRLAVLGGIIVIAVADGLADAMSIHISEESEGTHTTSQVWKSAAATFFSKAVLTLSFAVIVLSFELQTAIMISLGWGALLLIVLSYGLAKLEKAAPWKVIAEHLVIATFVIAVSFLVGSWVSINLG